MSKVISFRLDESNQREALAIQIIDKFKKEGYSLRHIITEALLKYTDTHSYSFEQEILNGMSAQLCSIERLLQSGSHPDSIASIKRIKRDDYSLLSDTFIAAVMKSAKAGLQSE